MCPDEYFYAGEDNELVGVRDVNLIEADRSPTYSCYKMFHHHEKNYFEATDICEDDKGHLISLEDKTEIIRLRSAMREHDKKNQTFLTSAIHMYFEAEWSWMGSNKTFNVTSIEEDDEGSCLAFDIEANVFQTVSCIEQSTLVCELRVETVTYFAWFVANWFSVLLVFLVVVLLISLCISTSMYRKRLHSPGRVYRPAASPVFEDKPPSYNRATGQNYAHRYLNKGREFWAKVTINSDKNTPAPTHHQEN